MTKDKPRIYAAYTEHYKTLCKHAWYAHGRPDRIGEILSLLPEDELGRKPNIPAINKWRNEQIWDAWADEMDAKAELIAEDELVNQRLVMLKRQASIGAELQTKAIDHLREHGFDTSASAVSAIKLGIATERTSKGISDRLVKLAELSDEQLTIEAQKLLDKALESGEIIDVAEVKEETEDAKSDSPS